MRETIAGLNRYIATPETSKHRLFVFLDGAILPDHKIIAIGDEDAFTLGILSSTVHATWALAAGGRMGVGNDPVYHKTVCFDSFPFPATTPELRSLIRTVAERLDSHRREALARDESLTMTGIYNIVEKIRDEVTLSRAEKRIYELAACGVLKDLHDELDGLVASGYGWPWPMERDEILSRLVALHDERVEEEKAGIVRWLRPEYQIPRFGKDTSEAQPLELRATAKPETASTVPWPAATIEQFAALQALLARGPTTVEQAAHQFTGARRDHVARHLETLAIMGEASQAPDGAYHLARQIGVAA